MISQQLQRAVSLPLPTRIAHSWSCPHAPSVRDRHRAGHRNAARTAFRGRSPGATPARVLSLRGRAVKTAAPAPAPAPAQRQTSPLPPRSSASRAPSARSAAASSRTETAAVIAARPTRPPVRAHTAENAARVVEGSQSTCVWGGWVRRVHAWGRELPRGRAGVCVRTKPRRGALARRGSAWGRAAYRVRPRRGAARVLYAPAHVLARQ